MSQLERRYSWRDVTTGRDLDAPNGGTPEGEDTSKMERILEMKDTRGRRNGGHINMNKE